MRVLLFGASGGIGNRVRANARAAGHELVIFARDPAKLEPLAAGESVIEGDISDESLVDSAVDGVDAVVSGVGPTSNSAGEAALFEGFARTLVTAMQRHGVRRLVTVSGGAVTLPGERKPLRARLASGFVRAIVGNVVAAKQRELDIIMASDLDWIAPRPPRVVEGDGQGDYRVGDVEQGMRVTQGDLADFMVKSLTDDTYLRQAPYISSATIGR